jgi:membrane-associated HD superfamily phosphohydrolase
MLADAVESCSRTLIEPTPGSLRKLVHDLLMKRLLDGQFDESSLTLTELHIIEESLSKGLIALYHSRIKYPEPEEAEVAS